MTVPQFNVHGVWAIYKFEMHRFYRTLGSSLAIPVITTALYFIVFGAAIGSRMAHIDGVSFGSFIVPGLMLLSLFTESIGNASFGIHMPKFSGTIYELLSAPLSALETVLGYVGAATTKSMIIALVILATANLFVDVTIDHPLLMLVSLLLIAFTFCLFGFILGIWAKGFEQLQTVPMLIVTPLTFLGGAFYSIHMLAEPWRTLTLFNPIVYLMSGFRWTFYSTADVSVWVCLGATMAFLLVCLVTVNWMFRTGYRLKS